jgi:glycosyltransferase involved in cell wall biosynthesis
VRGLVSHLARRHEVTLASLIRPGEEPRVGEVEAMGLSVVPLPFADRRAPGIQKLPLALGRARAWGRAAVSGYPQYVQKYWSGRLTRRIQDLVQQWRPDAIQIEYLQLALLVRDLRRWRDRNAPCGQRPAKPRLILNSHELGSLPRRRRAAATRSWPARLVHLLDARAWERLQRDATRWADVTLCVTEQDRVQLENQGGIGLRTVPLGIDTDSVQPLWQPSAPPKFLFVGSFSHRPNRIGAKFLVDKVWPRVAQYTKSGQLVLAGRGSRAFLRSLGTREPRIEALDYVEDLAPLFRDCQLFVAPLTEGGGIKIKILEAMARGIPVVTTPIGAEGIVDSAEDALVIANPDATFAESMIQALRSPEAARRRAERARRIIESRFSWSAITETLTFIYEGR